MLELRNVNKSYQMGDSTVYALRDVSVKVESGDFVAIMGPSGSGKSTLMHIMGLLDVPESGSYLVNGREVSQLDEDDLAVLRRKVMGFIFQQFNLLPRMTAAQNVALPLFYSEGKLEVERAHPVLDTVGLGTRMEHRPNELSGGQQQRVAIARSMINKPLMVLADEPTGNLDSKSEKEIMALLKQMNEQGITIVMVTHEDEIGQQARRLIRMRDGEIQSDERLAPLPKVTNPPTLGAADTQGGSGLSHIWQHFVQGIKTLAANKVRTGLSMLGILIGVAAVVAMLALGKGAQSAIESQLSSLGSNLLVLRSGASRGPGGAMSEAGAVTRFTVEDAEIIEQRVPGVKVAASNVNGRGQVTFGNKNWATSLIGTTSAYARMHSLEPDVGRFFTDEENQQRARVAVIGRTLVRELFNGQNPIGEMIKINKINFQVVGLLPEKGATGFRDQDDQILLPVETAMHRLLGKDYVDFIEIEVERAEAMDAVQDRTQELMYARKRVPPSRQQDAFTIRNMADIQNALSESTKIMTLLLSVIASISLLVGGIGIMNIMLVSVTERTREIGLRKAIGARRADILWQFLIESVVVSLVGGVLGILLAVLITTTLSAVSGWNTTITPSSVTLAFLFSAGVGIVFGIYPARKAAQLNPIDALRYE
ncbi:MAG TPA: ABC transporter permease [Oligoflexus sp.]|uniref:ABC transporter permease n=1 Tax=Oligoflexus sp. TaxID=1971216 RepID=UPI002D2BCB66|nr:ABC transporter permease [Oligoflexus sp.]HYX34498.1 ABC transporter permease [Oligoflexus sp.]